MEAPGYTPSPPEPTVIRPGQAGLQLNVDPEAMVPDGALRLDNFEIDEFGRTRIRQGWGLYVDLPDGDVHSLARMYLPSTGGFINFIGVGPALYRGATPATMAPVYNGTSGNPLTFVAYRPAISGDPRMIVADSVAVGQLDASNEIIALGVPAPVTGCTTRIVDILTTTISSFDTAHVAAAWVMNAGVDRSEPPVAAAAPTAADVVGLQGNCVEFTCNPGNASAGYSSMVALPFAAPLNLTQLQGGFAPATDEDIIHLLLRIDRPGLVEEIRVYFVCSSGFSFNVIPGQHESLNADAFVKTFSPSELTGFIEGLESSEAGSQRQQAEEIRRDYLERAPDDRYKNDERLRSGALPGGFGREDRQANRGTGNSPTTPLSESFAPGRNVWTQFGSIGSPLRRRDFTRIGTTEGRGWDTITGIVIVVQTSTNATVKVACDDWFLTGGYGLDSSEPGAQAYDYRFTHYNTKTGDEGNPSPIQADGARLQALRQRIAIIPNAPFAGGGQNDVRQRFYRRGGSLVDDWHYVGQNSANGAEFVDTLSDLEILNAPLLEIDNYQLVPTVNATGVTVLGQALPALWGPIDGALYGCGDVHRPGVLYRSKTNRPGSWPPDLATEVCGPSEELMHGFAFGGQGFVFTRRRLIATALDGDGRVVTQDTGCQKGLAGRWAFAVGHDGVYFVSDDGVYVTTGNAAVLISESLTPLFRGRQIGTYLPIDLASEAALRLTVHKDRVYFLYKDFAGARRCLVYSIPRKTWWAEARATGVTSLYSDRENAEIPLIYGLAGTGQVMIEGGTDDAGTAITGQYAGPHLTQNRPREEKLLNDLQIVGGAMTAGQPTVAVNVDQTTVLAAIGIPGTGNLHQRHVIDFTPQEIRGRTFQPTITWLQSAAERGSLQSLIVTTSPLPEETAKRIGQWEPLGTTGGYLTGVVVVCNTIGSTQNVAQTFKSVLIEYNVPGLSAPQTIGPFTLDASGGRRPIFLSWTGRQATQVRLVPQDASPWQLFALHWQWTEEPPTQNVVDGGPEVKGDTYYTGLDLVIDTQNQPATAEVRIDGAVIGQFNIQTNGKRLVHLTFGPGYGHIYQVIVTSGGGIRLYRWDWILDPVPGEQSNWNRNFEVAGTLTDKYVKGVLLECDTQGQPKTVQVQADGQVIATLTVTANGRSIVHEAFAQARGRVLRLLPIDANPGRLWSVQWVFDEEPLGLTRWETQLLDHGQLGWHSLLDGFVAYRSTTDLTLEVRGFDDHGVPLFVDSYGLPASAGEKRKQYVTFKARRAVLYKYLITAGEAIVAIAGQSAGICSPTTLSLAKTFDAGLSLAAEGALSYTGGAAVNAATSASGALLGSLGGVLATGALPEVVWATTAFVGRRYGWVEAYVDFSQLTANGWTLFAGLGGDGSYPSNDFAVFDLAVGTEAGLRKFWLSTGFGGFGVAELPNAFLPNQAQRVKVCWRQSTYTAGVPNADGEFYVWIDDVLVWSFPSMVIARNGDTAPVDITAIVANPPGKLDLLRIGYGTDSVAAESASRPQPCWVYREETYLQLTNGQPVQPFGSDNLDKVRQMGNASGVASTPNNG